MMASNKREASEAVTESNLPQIRPNPYWLEHPKLRKLWRDKFLYLLLVPVIVHLFIFSYMPMYGLVIAFQNYKIGAPLLSFSHDIQWVGFDNFLKFFYSANFIRVVRNTLLLGIYAIVFGFWVPVAFALLLNEVKNKVFKKAVQTLSYLPYFVSMVVIAGIMINFLSSYDGIVNIILEKFGLARINFFAKESYFRSIYTISGIWQTFGWTSIIYLASLSSIDTSLYESAKIDGANRFQQAVYISIPGIVPTIMILLILAVGTLLVDNTEKILLLYNPTIYGTADVIGSYAYRLGIREGNYSYAAAIGVFASVTNFILLGITNRISKKITNVGLW